MIVNYVMNT